MKEAELRALIEDVRTEKLPRRSFIERLVGLGLSAPMASMLLMHAGVAQSQPAPVYKPTKRGGGGALKTLWWQGPTLLQPHFANGTKDQEGSRVFYEPLAVWDNDGNLVPILAAEIPTRAERRRRSRAARSYAGAEEGRHLARRQAVHRRRRRLHLGVRARPGHRRASRSASTRTSTVDQGRRPHGRWSRSRSRRRSGPTAFVAAEGMIIPKHLFGPYAGAKSRDAPTNLKPVGTGPYTFVDFKPGDIVLGEINTNYHMPNRPYLRHDRDEGRRRRDLGGARRAADRRVRLRLEPAGRGRGAEAHGGRRQGQGRTSSPAATSSSSSSTSPTRGTRSTASAAASRASTSRSATRRCARRCRCSCDKKSMQEFIYGRTGFATAQLHEQPAALPLEEHEVGVQHRQGERSCSTPPAGSRAPTASARRAARR